MAREGRLGGSPLRFLPHLYQRVLPAIHTPTPMI